MATEAPAEAAVVAATGAVLEFDPTLSRVYARGIAAAAVEAQRRRLAAVISPEQLRQVAVRLDDDDQVPLQRAVRELADLLEESTDA